jgi:hypothetical protein
MPIQQPFYINGPSLASATAVFLDAALTLCAPDGFYSDASVVREQVGCVLLPQNTCPTCIVTPTYRCTAHNTLPPFGDGKYAMERTWEDPFYEFRLDSLVLNGVEYASGEILGVNSPGDLVIAPGILGGTYIQNISDWLNSIPGVNNDGLVFYDGMSTIDSPDSASTYSIKITRTVGGGFMDSAAPPWIYWYVKSVGGMLFSPFNSSTIPSIGYEQYSCATI